MLLGESILGLCILGPGRETGEQPPQGESSFLCVSRSGAFHGLVQNSCFTSRETEALDEGESQKQTA